VAYDAASAAHDHRGDIMNTSPSHQEKAHAQVLGRPARDRAAPYPGRHGPALRRAGSGPGRRLGHRLPLPGRHFARPGQPGNPNVGKWLRRRQYQSAATIRTTFPTWRGPVRVATPVSCPSLRR